MQKCQSKMRALEVSVSDLRLQQTALRKEASRHLQNLNGAKSAIGWANFCPAFPVR